MKQSLKWIGFVLFAALIGLTLSVAFVAGVRAQSPLTVVQPAATPATPLPTSGRTWGYGYWGSASPAGVYAPTQPLPYYGAGMMGRSGSGYGGWGMGPGIHGGMMGGWGRWGYGIGPTTSLTGTAPYGYGHMGGMMGGYGSRYWASPSAATPITLNQAVEAARQYLAAYGNPDLRLTEVMEFSGNFYAEVEEQSTGIHAFEVLIDRYTGAVYPELGPNMMWNTKYGHMGSWWGQSGDTITVTPEQARASAQQWLDVYLPGTTAADEPDAFYGYYTLHVLKDGQVYGMLSVNGYTGEVWYHTWHGDFVSMKEVEE